MLERNDFVGLQRCFRQFNQRAYRRAGNQGQIAESSGQGASAAQANFDALGDQLFNHALQSITGAVDLVGQAKYGSVRHQKNADGWLGIVASQRCCQAQGRGRARGVSK